MQNLFEYLINDICDQTILKEEALLYAEDMINESFKCELLTNLANQIKKAEKKNNQNKIERAKRDDEEYPYADGSKHDPKVVNFASIFGPLTINGRYNTKKGIQGLKWSEITEDDFKFIKANDEKTLKKALKPIYAKNGKGDAIVCEPDTKNPIMFIKGYGKDDDKRLYYFNMNQDSWNSGVKQKTATKYKYGERPLKLEEVLPIITDFDVYVLEITDDLIKTYTDLYDKRSKDQDGVINYDEKSLKSMLNKQQARYKALVAEIKAKKLQKDPNILFEEIKEVNTEVVNLYKIIVSKPEYLDKYFNLGCLMSYVSNAYESFYKSMKETREADRSEQRYGGRDSWSRKSAERDINDVKEYLDRTRKNMEEIKKGLEEIDNK